MADKENNVMDSETARYLNTACLVLEMEGQTWHIPFDTLHAIPRVGETIRLAGGSARKVAEVEYQFAPTGAPVELAREMPADALYAAPIRIVIKLS